MVQFGCWTHLIAAESNLETHDLALPLSFGHQEYHCPILVLTPANMVEAGLSDTKARVQQFVAAKKEQHHIITLILKVEHDEYSFPSGLEGFTRLQTLCVWSLLLLIAISR